MNTKEIEIYFNEEGTEFIYNGDFYNCEYLVAFEKLQILTEAEYSHKDEIDNMYDKDSLKPVRVKLYLDDNDKIMYLMVVYEILYKDHSSGRYACGAYQVSKNFFQFEGKTVVGYHNYQDSICW